jgi:hypothetical protein
MSIEFVDESGQGNTGWYTTAKGEIGYVIDGETVDRDTYLTYISTRPEMPAPPAREG